MILQCDQCNTKFRLDDSKLKPGGVKVRCSKCRHVFLAGVEQKQEESDFDAILSGLGAPTAAAVAAPEPPAPAEPAAKAQEPAAFTAQPAAAKPAAPAEPLAPAAPAAPEPAAAEPAAAPFAESDFPDFSTFDFAPEPAAQEKPAAAPAEEGFDAFDFTAPEEPVAKEEAAATTASPGLDYGDFSFMEEPAAPDAEAGPAAAAAPKEEFDFADFTVPSSPAEAEEKEAAAPAGALDFGEFEFNPEPAVKAEEPAPAPELDFGDIAFNEEPQPQQKPQEEPAEKGEFDFGDFSFSEEPPQAEAAPAAKGEFDFSDFSFSEEPPPMKETTAAEEGADLGAFPFSAEPAPKDVEEKAPPAGEFDFGDFSFGEEEASVAGRREPASEPFAAEALGAGLAVGGIAAAGATEAHPEPVEEPIVPPVSPVPPAAPEAESKKPAGGSSLDFTFGGPGSTPGLAAEEEEELPPLSITSRRKGRSVVTVTIVAICVAIILALTGAGLYLLQSGPSALAKFDKLGLGFVGKWFGMEAPEEGKIVIRKPLASFYQNKEAGELFVITGEAVNNFKKARASIHVKVSIFDKKGAVLVQKTAYCGNRLSKEQLETLPMAKIDSIMNNQFGDSLSNLSVKPGQAIGFVVALSNVPKEAADFGVEPVGSTVASQ